MKFLAGQGRRKYEQGQIVLLLAFSMIVLILSVGLALDLAFAYVTRARLSKAVDAACLTGMKNLALGQTTAQSLAISAFNVNYAGLNDAGPPSVNVAFATNTYSNLVVNVTGTANMNTMFMALLPGFRTLTISDNAQALRGKLVMSLALDRSGSMSTNGGSTALPVAVTTFINDFSNTNDEVSMASFASNATLDVPINYNFISPITTAVNALVPKGGTFGLGGLNIAKAQEDSIPMQTGQNMIKVVVYFTDGYVNEIQSILSCNGTPTLYNLGGYDSGTDVGFFNPTTGTQIYSYDGSGTWYTCGSDGKCGTPTGSSCLRNDAGFTSAIDGKVKPFTRANVTADAQYQSQQTANALLAAGDYIYSIGLGTKIDQTFLQEIANDPASPIYDPNLPQGMEQWVKDCPSSTCTASLQQVFQIIASRVLLRLTQ
jgi:hypothetical protein